MLLGPSRHPNMHLSCTIRGRRRRAAERNQDEDAPRACCAWLCTHVYGAPSDHSLDPTPVPDPGSWAALAQAGSSTGLPNSASPIEGDPRAPVPAPHCAWNTVLESCMHGSAVGCLGAKQRARRECSATGRGCLGGPCTRTATCNSRRTMDYRGGVCAMTRGRGRRTGLLLAVRAVLHVCPY